VRLGPLSVPLDRFDYNKVTGESSNQQLLLNIIRLRYGEPVHWIEVSSMISKYQFQASAGWEQWFNNLNVFQSPVLRGLLGGTDPVPDRQNQWNVGVQYQDSPTISYTPLEDQQFSQRFLTPVPITVIAYFIQAGWPAEQVFGCCVQRINDLENVRPAVACTRPADEVESGFQRLLTLLRDYHRVHHLSLRLQTDEQKQHLYLMSPPVRPDEVERAEFRKLLNLSQSADRIRLSEGAIAGEPDSLSIETRSLLGILQALSAGVEAPLKDRLKGRALTDGAEPAELEQTAAWIRVESSNLPQLDAFVQVYYHDSWFYIRKDDMGSKRTFSLLTYLYALQATGVISKGPFVTIQAGN
jgi:hypothetical protein